MKNLKGKCKTCFGCNMLDDFGFKGRKKCKNYIRANPINWIYLLIVFIEALIISSTIYMFYIWFSMKAGG